MNRHQVELQVKRHEAAASLRSGTTRKCPVCPDTNLVLTERQGVEIDYCPNCRGVWLDRGELDKILERSVAPPAPSTGAGRAPSAGDGSKRRKSWLGDLFS